MSPETNIDARALTGRCCWRPVKLSCVPREDDAQFVCGRPIAPPDDLLCARHADLFKYKRRRKR